MASPPTIEPSASPHSKANWSQIVRGDGEPHSLKLPDAKQTQPHRNKPPLQPEEPPPPAMAETLVQPEHHQVSHSSPQSLKTAPCLADESNLDDSSGDNACPTAENSSTVSKPAWGKTVPASRDAALVMGASSWPDLTEALNRKVSEPRKGGESVHAGPKRSFDKGSTMEATTQVTDVSEKSRLMQTVKGKTQPLTQDQSMKRNGQMGSTQHVDHGRMYNNRGEGMGSYSNNSAKWRNSDRDQGRGTYGWRYHGRGYGRDTSLPLHEQRIGPRNMHHPHPPPFVNIYPTFYNTPHLDYGNSGMYFMPVAAPDYGNISSPYFGPPGPPGGVLHMPDPAALRVTLVKQVEYYFSVENLCRDLFLRSNMDEQGFVHVTVIANFNRIRMLTPSIVVILEALRNSAVIEVQGERIRRREDWARWVLRTPPQPGFASHPGHNGMESSSRRPQEVGKGHMWPDKDDDQVGHVLSIEPSLLIENAEQQSSDIALSSGEFKASGATETEIKHRGGEGCLVSGLSSMLLPEDRASQDLFGLGTSVPSVSKVLQSQTGPLRVRHDNGAEEKSFSARLCSPEIDSGSSSGFLHCELKFQSDIEGFFFDSSSVATGIDSLTKGIVSQLLLKDAGTLRSAMNLSSSMREVSYQIGKDLHPSNGVEDDAVDVNDKDVQRLITVTHAQLGSYIAVP